MRYIARQYCIGFKIKLRKKSEHKKVQKESFFPHILPLSNEKRFNETQPYFI